MKKPFQELAWKEQAMFNNVMERLQFDSLIINHLITKHTQLAGGQFSKWQRLCHDM